MKLPESILRPVKLIRGGMHLEHHKNTAECETVVMPAPKTVYIPLSQHIGAPATPVVKKGDSVFVGTLIGEANGFVSAPVHSSVSGTVTDVKDLTIGNGTLQKYVIIESDGKMEKDPSLKPFKVKKFSDLAEAAKLCGLVGLGGAGFPTHVKLSPSKDVKIDTLIINAAECEPYITSDYRECVEGLNDVIEGVYLIKKKLGIEKVVIGVEKNKPIAIELLMHVAADHRDHDDSVKVMKLPAKYPQGAEKVIIYSATGRKLPAGKLPSDVGCIVMNVTSVATLYRFITTGMPLVSKRITVDGTAVSEPKNVIVPIGTPINEILDFVGVDIENTDRILMGGPMMGNPVVSDQSVLEKRNNAILAMRDPKPQMQTACIRCGRCADTCPMSLYPAMVETALRVKDKDALNSLNINYCMECGCCSYVCPAKRPLTQIMRTAKAEIRRQK
ncbi:MAG: electron transport complex subunit RsxC [Clostridia bacterium]|nr:electron transport complex subunit RsxC [Clostridia bacterium]